MRRFVGTRTAPPETYAPSGLTNGAGSVDYQGVIFDDGSVAVRWLTQFRSTSVWQDYETFYRVHGHPEYGTVIRFLDADELDPGEDDGLSEQETRAW